MSTAKPMNIGIQPLYRVKNVILLVKLALEQVVLNALLVKMTRFFIKDNVFLSVPTRELLN